MANTAAYRGAGFYVSSGSASLVNNSIVRNRNTLPGSTTAGLLIWTGATATGRNNIIYDNLGASQPDISGSGTMTYCDIAGGYTGTGNINASPLFVNSATQGYCLLAQIASGQGQNSPCVNTGDPASTMVTGTTRSDHVQDAGIVDMGFHWPITVTLASRFGQLMAGSEIAAQTEPATLPASVKLSLSNAPNPFNPSTVITLVIGQAAPAELKVYDVAGRMVADLFQGHLEAGAHQFEFSGANLPAGVYVYRAVVAGNTMTGKALLVK